MASATARQYEISGSLLTRWRREARDGTLGAEAGAVGFAAVAVADAPPPPGGRGTFVANGFGLRAR
jgi:transposase-like protein